MLRVGTVTAFDAEAGLGEVAAENGDRFAFHCTAIVDGSRVIDVGRRVGFLVGAGGPGRWEALQVAPVT